jgi:Protein kinase domain
MVAIGTRLGAYQITSLLGQGGMGEVYRATDTKLNRDVPLKLLPEQITSDRDRLERFRREAHVLASLNHSNIAATKAGVILGTAAYMSWKHAKGKPVHRRAETWACGEVLTGQSMRRSFT